MNVDSVDIFAWIANKARQWAMATTNSISYASEMAQEKHSFFCCFVSVWNELVFVVCISIRFGQTTFSMGFALKFPVINIDFKILSCLVALQIRNEQFGRANQQKHHPKMYGHFMWIDEFRFSQMGIYRQMDKKTNVIHCKM